MDKYDICANKLNKKHDMKPCLPDYKPHCHAVTKLNLKNYNVASFTKRRKASEWNCKRCQCDVSAKVRLILILFVAKVFDFDLFVWFGVSIVAKVFDLYFDCCQCVWFCHQDNTGHSSFDCMLAYWLQQCFLEPSDSWVFRLFWTFAHPSAFD